MNHTRGICRSLSGLPRRADLLIASAAAPAVLWADPPLPPGWNKHSPVPASPRPALRFPSGWNKHPPLPAHVHPLATSGIPGWQLTLMAVTVILLVAVVVMIAYPGPGRTAASAPTHRLSDDRIPRNADPQGQPAALARPATAHQDHRAGPRP
jgi:hypothetical protein